MLNLNAPVLVLSSSYEAVQICSLKRAVLLMLGDKAYPVEKHESRWVRSPSMKLPVPEVIRLNRYVRARYEEVPFCRKNIFMRDGYRCQYCNSPGTGETLTIDHILPLSRGGSDRWDNVVAACRSCNSRKGNHTAQECGFELISPPRKPTSLTLLHIMRQQGARRSVWRKYLFFEQDRRLVSTGFFS